MSYTATYSPDDNKLRLYASSRLDADTYARVKAAGFKWAPKQDLFVAPMWTPHREDLLLELCGEIDDEDKSLVERAEERADRFETYSDKRAADADRAHSAVSAIADNIPLGQPILVGHHSERHARRDAEKIENGMRRAVKMWETSKYWTDRAEGAISHAKYKERPDVRARRIKTIEADRRRELRAKEKAEMFLQFWTAEGLTLEGARQLAGVSHLNVVRDGAAGILWSAYDVLRPDDERYQACPAGWTVQMVQDVARKAYPRTIAHCDRWIAHCDNRLAYERAMLAASGWTPPPKPKTKADLPLLNYPGTVSYRNMYSRDEIVTTEAVPITKAQLAAINSDYKGTRVSACGTHRVRTAMHVPGTKPHSLVVVYLSDSKQHARPGAESIADTAAEELQAKQDAAEAQHERYMQRVAEQKPADDREEKFRALKETAAAGVQVVTSPTLYPTPPEICRQMVASADIRPKMRVLEPSAGTGNIADAIREAVPDAYLVCNELNHGLVKILDGKGHKCMQGDFLEFTAPPYDRIVMNPPFDHGSDIQHIKHALELLAPGGRLVSLCANGPRQQKVLREDLDAEWHDLPADTFKGISVAMIVLDAPRQTAAPIKAAEQRGLFA